MDEIAKIENLSFVADTENATSFTINAGEILAISGMSGQGKSLLIRTIAGLNIPFEGNIEINGTRIFDLSEAQRTKFRKENIAISYDGVALIDSLNVEDNVGIAVQVAGVETSSVKLHTKRYLDLLGIGHLNDQMPQYLSQGETQRVSLARALASHRPIILLDDPMSNLHPEQVTEVMDVIVAERDARDCTIVISTNDKSVRKKCKRVFDLDIQEFVRK